MKQNLIQQKVPGRGCIVLWLVAAVLFACFAILTVAVAQGSTQTTDLQVAQNVYNLRSPGLNTFAEMVTYTGNIASIIVVCLVLLAFPKTRLPYGVPVAAVAIVTTTIKAIVKTLVARPRPDEIYHLIEQGGWSFPSGHAITSIAVYGMILFLIWHYHKIGSTKGLSLSGGTLALATVVLAFLAIGIGLSRVYVGVHYPTDVLGGYLAGLGTMLTAIGILLHLEGKKALQSEEAVSPTA